MSDKFKLKYEVVAILRDNIIKGLESFGVPIQEEPGDGGWVCIESEQPSYRNADNAILFYLEKTERIGCQSSRRRDSEGDTGLDVVDYFIEQQIWKIKVVCKRSTETITDDNIPIMGEDVLSMLIGWFNRLGCQEFRKHNMANLFVQMKDVRTYRDKSDVSQWTAEFPLKLQVIKQFETDLASAEPVYKGSIGIKGEAETGRKSIFERFYSSIKNLLMGN